MGQLETNLQTAVANPKQIASLAGGPESQRVLGGSGDLVSSYFIDL